MSCFVFISVFNGVYCPGLKLHPKCELSVSANEATLMNMELQYNWTKTNTTYIQMEMHYDVIKWKHFPRYCPFVWSLVDSPKNGE